MRPDLAPASFAMIADRVDDLAITDLPGVAGWMGEPRVQNLTPARGFFVEPS